MRCVAVAAVCSRTQPAVWLALACTLAFALGSIASHAGAQDASELARVLTVEGVQPGCVTAPALRARLARYLPPGTRLGELRITIDLASKPPGFRVMRQGELLSERRFERVPAACAERRDALALAVAVAIEHAIHDASASGEPTAPAGSSSTPPVGSQASDSGPATAAESGSAAAGSSPAPAATSGSATAAVPQRAQAAATARAPEAARPLAAPSQTREPSTTADMEAADEADDESESDDPSAEASAPRTRSSARVLLFGGALYLVEALPDPAAAFVLGAELAVRPWLRIGLAALVSPPTEHPFAGRTVVIELYGGQGLVCLNALLADLIVHGCGGVAAALVRAEGDGFTLNRDVALGWIAGQLRASLEYPASGRLAGRLVADGRINLMRPELESQPQRVSTVRVLGGSVGAEFVVRLE